MKMNTEGNFDMKETILTPKQQEAVDFDGKEMLIKGIAGSGKTLVLLKKAHKILTTCPDEQVYLFTYVGTLAAYTRELAATIGSQRLHVDTFHAWAFRMLRRAGVRTSIVQNEEQVEMLRKSMSEVFRSTRHRLVAEEKYFGFLAEEIQWMKGKSLLSREGYLAAARVGRGTKVFVDGKAREVMYAVFERYQEKLQRAGKIDYDDLSNLLDASFAKWSPYAKLDNVLIDEAQDLQEVQLKLLRKCANKRIVIAADQGQKIYNTSFSWRGIGINITGGRTKVLQNSFRSTQQIISLAYSLQKHDPLYKEKDEEYVYPVIPERQGPVPMLIQLTGHEEEEMFVVKAVQELHRLNPNWTIGILCRKKASLARFHRQLPLLGVPTEYVEKDKGSVTQPGAKLLSLHSAKGLEFDAVYVFRMREKTVPLYDQLEDLDDEVLATERRLLYVAMTRAKTALTLTYSGKRSRFIEEMDDTLYEYKGVGV
ncbi:ATP-dependent helicase [Paenibacillus sp. PFR10]|uniref:DNA 3'-5' helicase n=2 Tax=Paenibacillus TaxID=44249 RepID=A0ABU3RPA2_9BACL|nr:ATP-dependent helicase [Paenibacillus sp. PFR10]